MLEVDLQAGSQLASEYAGQVVLLLLQVIAGLMLLIVIQISIIRIINNLKQKYKSRFVRQWRPIITGVLIEPAINVPDLPDSQLNDFTLEWNGMYEKVSGPARESLVDLAGKVRLAPRVRAYLIRTQPKYRLLAIVTLGNLRDRAVLRFIKNLAKSEHPIISLAAFRASVQIDAQATLMSLADVIIERDDWPQALVARVLKETGSANVCHALTDAALTHNEHNLSKVLSLMGVSKCPSISLVVKSLLKRTKNPGIVAACLQIVDDPKLIEYAHAYVAHDQWFVRLHAYALLGRIGGKSDLPVLLKGLSDKEWWVRYRSAQALISMPVFTRIEMSQIYSDLEDRYARDILKQAIAEKELL